MAFESSGSDVLDQYRNISNKLKKRFLRKPNVTEACESFASLGQQCESNELPAYAGMCWISAARCEGSLSNIPGEGSCLVRAARQFLQAEETDYNLGCPSPCQENLQAGLGCYAYAVSRYPEDCSIPLGLDLEIIHFLKKIGRNEDVEDNLNSVVDSELSKDHLDTKIYALKLQAWNFVESNDYVGALNVFTEIVSIIEKLPITGARSEVLLKCEINRVLLLLILRPAPQKLSPNLTRLLEKYTWGDHSDKTLKACAMSEKMFLLLQSLVAVCQSLDTTNLSNLESELWPIIGNEERDLLRILIRIYLR